MCRFKVKDRCCHSQSEKLNGVCPYKEMKSENCQYIKSPYKEDSIDFQGQFHHLIYQNETLNTSL